MPSQDAYDDMGCICFDAVVVYIYMCIVIWFTTQKKIKTIDYYQDSFQYQVQGN